MNQLPPDWSWGNLGQLSLNAGDYGSGAAALHFTAGLPRYVRVTDIAANGTLDPISCASITDADARGYYLKANDLLFARSGATVGKTYLYDESDGCCAHAGYVIKFSLNPELCCPRFVSQWTRSQFYWSWIANTFRQGAQPNINAAEYRRLPVPVATLAEQSRIAAVLDTVDAAIAKTEAVIGKLRQVRAGLLHDLLTRGLDEHGELRDPIAHPENFQDSPLGRIPKGWEVKTLEACVSSEITYGIVQAGPHVEGGIPYIRTGDMSGDRLYIDRMLRTSPEIASRFRRSRVQCGEIVCAIRATVGKVLPVPPELDGANLTQGTARIAPKPEIEPTYLLWAIRSDRTQCRIAKEVKGTTFAEITLAELRKVEVPVPMRRREQEDIAAVTESLETQLQSETEGLGKLQSLKSGLMSDLLSGRVRVPEATTQT